LRRLESSLIHSRGRVSTLSEPTTHFTVHVGSSLDSTRLLLPAWPQQAQGWRPLVWLALCVM
jgi:hypothetical protein